MRFNETIEEAIADDIKSLGGPKAASGLFFTDKTPEQGAYVLRAWTSESKAERPSPSQLMLLIERARAAAGYSEVARYMEQRLCCRIEFLSPEDELARLQQQFVNAVDVVKHVGDRIERLLPPR